MIPALSQPDGSYQVGPLLAGNYSVTAVAGDLVAVPERVRTSSTDLLLNLTLAPSGTVTGRTNLFGTPRPFATLEFRSAVDPRMVRTATSDGNARYSIRLAAGEWFVSGRFYDSTFLYATLGRVVIHAGTALSFDAIFLDGVRVNGTVRDPNPAVQDPQADIAFSGPSGQLWLRTDPQGGYFAFLPAGTYDLEALNRAGAYFASATFSGTTRKDIDLVESSETVAWRVYRDANGNGALDPGEEIAGARVDLRDDRGAHLFLTTPAAGEFTTRLFGNRTYAGSVSAPGYAARTISASSPAELRGILPLALTPIPIDVEGTVLLNGAPFVNRPVRVSAVPLGGGAVAASTLSDSNGAYALHLVPGTYDLTVDENVTTSRDLRYQNLGSDRIVLAVGQTSLSYDVRFATRNRIFGQVTLAGSPVATTIRFDGPDPRTVQATTAGYETYLRSGTYVAMGNQTIASRDYGFVSTVTVSSVANLSFAFANATRVSGRVLFNAVAVPGPMAISFIREGGGFVTVATDSTGAYSTILIPGTYSVGLSATGTATENSVTRFYRYSFSGAATVPSNQPTLSYDLATSRILDNTTVSGIATAGGLRVPATVTFTARGGAAISAQATADSNGVYSISLAPGTYDVYATRTFGTVAHLARITVPHASSYGRDLLLTEAFQLSGITTNAQGAPVSAPITIQSSAQLDLTSDANGQYSAILPQATYTITATKGGTENGIPVTYRASTSLTLQTDAVVPLRLTKVVTRSATITWDASERRTIPAGGSVSYSIVVRNTGNVADTYALAGSPSDWEFSFSPASVSQDFGDAGTSTVVHVVIETPPNALVDHGTVQITSTSTADGSPVGSVTVLIDIERVRALSSSLDTSSAMFDGRRLDYIVLVTNAGNARETVDVAITNPDDLAAVGWTVQLGTVGGPASGTTLRNLIVEANQTIRVQLVAQSTRGSSGPTVVLHVAAADSVAVSVTRIFTLQLPALASGGVAVTGPEISQRAPLDMTLVALVAGAAAAVAAGLFLTRRRR